MVITVAGIAISSEMSSKLKTSFTICGLRLMIPPATDLVHCATIFFIFKGILKLNQGRLPHFLVHLPCRPLECRLVPKWHQGPPRSYAFKGHSGQAVYSEPVYYLPLYILPHPSECSYNAGERGRSYTIIHAVAQPRHLACISVWICGNLPWLSSKLLHAGLSFF